MDLRRRIASIVKRRKYNNRKTEVDGTIFDSKMEADYYRYLLEQPDIETIELQPTFLLQEAFKKLGRTTRKIEYKPDFLLTYKNGDQVAIDVKGALTDVFKLKAKLFDHCYPHLELRLVTLRKGEWVDPKGRASRE
jgi:hypothetical protein